MGSLVTLSVVFMIAVQAARQIRENRRRGIRYPWARTAATVGGVLLMIAIGGGVMAGLISLNWPVAGVFGFFIVVIGGIVGMSVWVNRHWPVPGNSVTAPIDRKGALLLALFFGLIMLAMGSALTLASFGHDTIGTAALFTIAGFGILLVKRLNDRWWPSSARDRRN